MRVGDYVVKTEQEKQIWGIIAEKFENPIEFIPPDDWIENGSYTAALLHNTIGCYVQLCIITENVTSKVTSNNIKSFLK